MAPINRHRTTTTEGERAHRPRGRIGRMFFMDLTDLDFALDADEIERDLHCGRD